MKPAALEARALTQQLLGIMGGLTVRGVGVDVISIARVEQALKRHGDRFATRVLSAREWERYARMEAGVSVQSLRSCAAYVAKQFSAKEAIAKALGTGIAAGVTFHQLVVLRNASGAPEALLEGAAQQRLAHLGADTVRITLSDDSDWAVAMALLC